MLFVDTLKYENGKLPRVKSVGSMGEKNVTVTVTGPAVSTKMEEVAVTVRLCCVASVAPDTVGAPRNVYAFLIFVYE